MGTSRSRIVHLLAWLLVILAAYVVVIQYGSGIVFRNGWKAYTVEGKPPDKALIEFIERGMAFDISDPSISYRMFSGHNTSTQLALVNRGLEEYFVELRRQSASEIAIACITEGRFNELLEVVQPAAKP